VNEKFCIIKRLPSLHFPIEISVGTSFDRNELWSCFVTTEDTSGSADSNNHDEYIDLDEFPDETQDQTIVFGTASFLNDTSSDMIAPIWPTFLRTQLSMNLFEIGIVDGLALTITSLSKLGAGYASDRSGKRKSFITLGYFLSMFSRIGFAISTGFYHILLWKSADRLGKIRGPPRDALVADQVSQEKRGRAFGLLRAMDSAGAVVGTIITLLLFSYLGYIGIILLAAIPALGSVIVIAVLVKERRVKDIFKGVSFRGYNRNLKIFLLASVMFAIATFSYSFLILFSSESFGFNEIQLILLYLVFTIADAGSAYPGRKPILVIAFVLLCITAAWTHLVVLPLAVLPLFIFYGLAKGALEPVQTSFVVDLVEPERRASTIGAFQMAIGISALPGGAIIGYLWEVFNPLVAFNFALILAILATIVLLIIRPSQLSVT
jgi:MFS family permease